MSNNARTKHLTTAQAVKLTQWFEKNRAVIESAKMTQTQAAERATQDLGFQVSNNQMRRLIGAGDEVVIQFNWPNTVSSNGSSTSVPTDRMRKFASVVRNIIGKLESELGIKFDESDKAVLNTVIAGKNP